MPNALDLYGKVEDLLGVNEVTPTLYKHYYATLETLNFRSLLDVGCGKGVFLEQVQSRFPEVKVTGVDLSPYMVEQTQKRGIDAYCIDLCKLEGKFDVITAVFDMINYLNENQLKQFMRCVVEHLEEGGYFLCDINSLYAFKEIAVGSFIKDDGRRFVTIDSDFEEDVYYSQLTLFEKIGDHFVKSQENLDQYYHRVDKVKKTTSMRLLSKKGIAVYGKEVEKFFLVFKKLF